MAELPRVALLFPGQGSQFVGMGKTFWERFPEAREAFATADSALSEPLSQVCFEGPEGLLNDTQYTQPAVLACSIAIWRALSTRSPVVPLGAAGHSLGEYSALVAAGAVCLEDAVRLVRVRARCMQEVAGEAGSLGMSALLGLSYDEVQAICRQASDGSLQSAAVANHNCPGQIVVGGHTAALKVVERLAKERGAKKAVRLAVSVASHTPLMQSAAEAFSLDLAEVRIATPRFPVVGNALVEPLRDPNRIRQELALQLTHAIDWPACLRELTELGASEMWEIGPRPVLAGLSRRTPGSPPVRPITAVDELSRLLAGAREVG